MVLTVFVAVLALPAKAVCAGAWSWPVDGEPGLRYGATYAAADGRTCTHGGLDIDSSAGSTVRSCAAGEVAFAGLVPGSDGGRVWAVTVLTADSLRVTYLPLTSADVSKGRSVAAGDALGTLARSGDASADGPHLHLGVKRGGTALDPLAFLADRTPAAHSGAASSGSSGGDSAGAASSRTTVHAGSFASAASAVSVASAGSVTSAARASVASKQGSAVGVTASASEAAATLRSVLQSLGDSPPLMRVEPVSAPAFFNMDAASADIAKWRATGLGIAAQIALLALAVGCAWAVMRNAGSAGAASSATLAARRARD
jgi:hypothetical protein